MTTYSDIYLVPRYSAVTSRSQCCTLTSLGEFYFGLPIVPSNMVDIISPELALKLSKKGYFYIMHRFMSNEDQIRFIKKMNREMTVVSISVGVKVPALTLIAEIERQNLKVDFITIDVAHAHSVLVKNMIEYVKMMLPDTFLIVGNIGSIQGAIDIQAWGADCLKVGIGNGSICLTTPTTGFHCHPTILLPKLTMINVPIIADGGIKEIGDISKALVLGADIVMVGGLLAGCDESPSEQIEVDGEYYHKYAGSTSKNEKYVEGKQTLVPNRGSIFEWYHKIRQGLQSAISYAGGNDLKAFNKVEYRYYT